MLTLAITAIVATFLAFIDLSFTRLCSQPYIFCTLAFYVMILYSKRPFKRLIVTFFALMLLAHFLYDNELRLFWYLIPLTLASSYGQRLRFSKRYQPGIFFAAGMIAHRLIIDHCSLMDLLSWDCTTFFPFVTLILVVLISLK